MNPIDKYWMVHNGQGACSIKHTTEQSAIQEAKRLAQRQPEYTFTVLEAKRAFRLESVVEIPICSPMPMPPAPAPWDNQFKTGSAY